MTTTMPPSTAFSCMQYCPATSSILLYDESGVGGSLIYQNSTYSWLGTNWSLLESGSYLAPPVRVGACMAPDNTNSGAMTLFGGQGLPDTGYFNDVWISSSGTSWTQQIANHNTVGPTIRSNSMMAGVSTGCVLFGGKSLFPWLYQDLWLYASGTWTSLISTVFSPSTTSPPARINAAFASNANNGTGTFVAMFGGQGYSGEGMGDLWVLSSISTSGATWTQYTIAGTAPTYRTGMAMVWDNAASYFLCYGGQNSAGVALGDTYSLTLNTGTGVGTFTLLNAGTSNTQFNPQWSWGAQLASDGVSNTILFGGRQSKNDLNNTFQWNSGSKIWVQQ